MSSPINLGFLRHSWRYFANNASFWKIVVSWIGDSCLFYKDFVLGSGRFAVISLWGFHRIQVQVHHIVIKMKILWARWKLCQEKFIDAWWYMFGPLFWELGSDLRGAWSLFGRYCEKNMIISWAYLSACEDKHWSYGWFFDSCSGWNIHVRSVSMRDKKTSCWPAFWWYD